MMEDEQPEATRPKRPLSYAEIVAIHKSCEDVSFAPKSNLSSQQQQQQQQHLEPHDSQSGRSNTLPRSKRKPRGAGAGSTGTGSGRIRTYSGSYQQDNAENGQRTQTR